MFSYHKTVESDKTVLFLKGVIDENASLDLALKDLRGLIEVNCREVSRVNSMGIKQWIKSFQFAESQGCVFCFLECSSAIVEQVNLIANFLSKGTIESLFAPFVCQQCKIELNVLFSAVDLKKNQFRMPKVQCSACQADAFFDDIEQEYFGFLMR